MKKTLRLPDYLELQDIIKCIMPEIQDLFWICSDTLFSGESSDGEIFCEWDENYDQLFIEDFPDDGIGNPRFRLSQRGFLNKYAKFILPDWTEIYGIKNKIVLSDITDSSGMNIRESLMNEISEIIFGNVDAAFWFVESRNQILLDKIKKAFPLSFYIQPDFMDKK